MPSSSSAANNEQHSIIDDASQKSTKSLPGRILSNSSHSHSNHGDTITDVRRYAIKHLRPGLHRIYDQRTFNCAAVDLIMEAHILLSLQVPYEGSWLFHLYVGLVCWFVLYDWWCRSLPSIRFLRVTNPYSSFFTHSPIRAASKHHQAARFCGRWTRRLSQGKSQWILFDFG